MSILIKGITKPTDCILCPMLIGAWQMCGLLNREVNPKGTPKNCPMVELPPHGRLIDAYELAIEILKLQKYRFSIEDPEIFVSRKAVMQAISDNPTVIEAEGVSK